MSHIHEKIDFTTDVIIVHKGKVLLRKHEKYNVWLGPGGHVELDEDPNQAAMREAKEEVGLDIQLWDTREYKQVDSDFETIIPPQFFFRHKISETHTHVSMIFFATCKTDVFENPASEKSEEIRWFTKEELFDPRYKILPRIQVFCKKALETVK